MSFGDRSRKRANLDVRALLDVAGGEVLARLLECGVLVSFGVTRDGGALSVTIYANNEKHREWFTDPVDCGEWMNEAADEFGSEH